MDDGIFAQVGNGVFHGFSSTVGQNANHLLIHASPILVVTFPFVRIFDGAPGLVVLQSFACAAVVFPVFGLARMRFSNVVAFAVTLVAACYPPLSGEAVGDFHELAFAPALGAAMVLALDRRAWRWAIAAAIALACVKEDQFVALAFIGAVVALTSRSDPQRRRCGMLIAIVGVAGAALYFGVVRPMIDPHFPYWSLHYYQWWWFPPTPNGFAAWNSPLRIQYLIAAFAPLAFLPLLSRRYLIFTLPGLAEVMLSHEAITLFIGAHYSATWSGYMLCAFIDGAGWLASRSVNLTKAGLVAALAISIWTSENYSPTSPGYFLYRKPLAEDAAKERELQSLPRTATILTSDELFAHLGMYPNAVIAGSGQEYLIYDTVEDSSQLKSPTVQALIARGKYRTVTQSGNLVVLQRRIPLPVQVL